MMIRNIFFLMRKYKKGDKKFMCVTPNVELWFLKNSVRCFRGLEICVLKLEHKIQLFI